MKIDIKQLKRIEEACGQFEIGKLTGGTNNSYLCFGNWEPTNIDRLTQILGPSIVVEEDSDYDDQSKCWKYSYVLYDLFEWEKIKRKRETSWCYYSGMPNPTSYA
jgi:hypothetical protein